jgi:hypothetical protein
VEAPTYAQRADARKKRVHFQEREDFPHMLLVCKGQTDRIPLTRMDFDDVVANLEQRVLNYVTEEGHITLRVAFIQQLADGTSAIACKDLQTKAWFRAQVADLELEGVKYRAWDAEDKSHLREARINITGIRLREPVEVLKLIRGFNPELKGELKIIRTDTQPSGQGDKQILIVQMDDDFAATLGTKEEPWVVEFGTAARFANYRGIPALMSRLRERGLDELAASLDRTKVSGEEETVEMNDAGVKS